MDRIRKLVTSFADYTSIHGIGRISSVKYCVHKLFWALVFCGSLAMLSFQVYRLGQQYVSHNVNTKITVKHGKQPFPAVTICNLNPVKFSAVMKNKDLYQTLDTLSYKTKVPLTEFYSTVQLPNFNYSTVFDFGNKLLKNGKKQFLIDVLELGEDELEKMSETFEEFVVDCTFHGERCNISNFNRKRTDDYGFCYELISDFETDAAGPYNGLEMVLNIKQNEYVPFITQSAGVKVVIQDAVYDPNLQQNTFAVPAGFEINVGLAMTVTKRYEGVDKRCDPLDVFLSVTACIQQCMADYISRYCSCFTSWEKKEQDETLNACYQTTELECIEEREKNMVVSEECGHCKPPCSERKYETHISMTKWPAANYEPYLRRLIGDSIKDYKEARDDMLLIRVFFQSLESLLVEEEAAYTEENFVSDIGGQLGLWCGLSVLSCVEVIELLCFLFTAVCHAKFKKEKRDGKNGGKNGGVGEMKDLMKDKENPSNKNIPDESLA